MDAPGSDGAIIDGCFGISKAGGLDESSGKYFCKWVVQNDCLGILADCSSCHCYSYVSMSNLLGINFFRVVSEPVGEDWSQVYAKVPFEQEELLSKGGVFGVLRLMGGKDIVGRGSELISKLEEKYNEGSDKNMLEAMASLVIHEESGAEFVLAEVSFEKDNLRTLRLKASKSGWGQMVRGKKKVTLISEETGDQIIRGVLVEGDRLFIGVGGVEKLLIQSGFDWNSENLEGEVETLSSLLMSEEWPSSMAGMLFEIKELVIEELDRDENEVKVVHRGDAEEKAVIEPKLKAMDESEVENIRVKPKSNLITSVVRVFGKISKRNAGGEKVVLRNTEVEGHKKRWTLIVGGIFLLAMVVSVFAGYLKMQTDKKKSVYQGIYEPLEKKRQDALAMATLNPSGARDLMMQVRQGVAEHNGEYSVGEFAVAWNEFGVKTEEAWQKVSGEQKAVPDLFFDLSLIRSGLVGQAMSFSDDKLAIMDSQLGVVVSVEIPNKTTEVVMGKGIQADWREVSWVETQPVVVTGTNLVVGDTKVTPLGEGIANVAGAASFGNFIYVLDKNTGEVWKYTGTGSGSNLVFGTGSRWLKGSGMPELTDGVAMAIDGDVWVGLSAGQVIRLRRGSKEKFEMMGVPANMKLDGLAVSSDENLGENTGKIAVLDKKGSRIVIFDKAGVYVKQLEWGGLANANDLVLLNDSDLIVLSQGKLWKMGL